MQVIALRKGDAKNSMGANQRKSASPRGCFNKRNAAPKGYFSVRHSVNSRSALRETVCGNCGGLGYVCWLNKFYDIHISDCLELNCGKSPVKEHWPETELRADDSTARGELVAAGGSRLPCDAISGTLEVAP